MTDESSGDSTDEHTENGDDPGRIPIRIDEERDELESSSESTTRVETAETEDQRDDGWDETEPAADDPYAPEPSSTPIERGDPTLENAVFVLIGAVAMMLVIFRMASIVVG